MNLFRPWTSLIVFSISLFAVDHVLAQLPPGGVDENSAEMTANVTQTSVQVAEPFLLEVKCLAPAGAKVNFPAVPEQIGDLDVIDHQDIFDVPIGSSSNRRSWTRRITLESIVTGELTIPAIEVQVSNATETKRLASNPLAVSVLSVLEDRPDPKDFRDVKPLVDVEIESDKSYAWAGWTAGGLAGGSLLALALVSLVRRSRFVTPVQWANRQFDQLERAVAGSSGSSKGPAAASDLTLRMDSESVSCQLSSIIREFVELQLEISAPNQTTDELQTAVSQGAGVDQDTVNRIGNLFRLADQAKYAGVELSKTQLQDAIQEGRILVNQIANHAVVSRPD